MLPLNQSWYRKLLGYALMLGLVGGSLAVVYMGVTGAGSDVFFGDAGSDWWTGEWWWIPLIALGGVIVAWLRQLLSVDDEVPGAIAYAQKAWVDPASAPRLAGISVVSLAEARVTQPLVRGLVGGGLVGLIAVALPLALTSSSSQLATLTDNAATLGAGLLAAVIIAKMLAIAISLSAGLLGGTVLPMIFLGAHLGSSSTSSSRIFRRRSRSARCWRRYRGPSSRPRSA